MQSGQTVVLLIFIAALVIMGMFYLLKLKRIADHNREIERQVKVGVDVVTFSGIIGRVTKTIEKDGVYYVVVETGDGVNKSYLMFDRDAIFSVLVPEDDEEVEQQPKDEINVKKTMKTTRDEIEVNKN